MHEDGTHCVGQFYGFLEDNGEKDIFILARSERSKVVLISLRDGNSWGPPVKVNSPRNITAEEFARVSEHEDLPGRWLRAVPKGIIMEVDMLASV